MLLSLVMCALSYVKPVVSTSETDLFEVSYLKEIAHAWENPGSISLNMPLEFSRIPPGKELETAQLQGRNHRPRVAALNIINCLLHKREKMQNFLIIDG